MGTTVNRSGEAMLRIRVTSYGEAQVEPESPGTENAKSGIVLPGSGHSQWGIEYPCHDDAHVEPESPCPDEAQLGSISLVLGEAQLRTRVTRFG